MPELANSSRLFVTLRAILRKYGRMRTCAPTEGAAKEILIMTDRVWIEERIKRTQEGEIEAFGEIVQELQAPLRGFIAMLGVKQEDIPDIAQETFVLAYKSLDKYETDRAFSPWLRGIARNLVRRWRTEQEKSESSNIEEIIELLASDEDEKQSQFVEEQFQLGLLKKCIDKLPARSAELVSLRYEGGKDSFEIAEILKKSAAAVRVTLARLRLKLRECVDQLISEEGLA